jgi:ATP-binding cassette subfamily F protein uup
VNYEGTLLLVSHDRAFLDNVVTGTLVHEDTRCFTEYTGGYEDWVCQRKMAEATGIPAPAPAQAVAPQKGVKVEKGRKFLNREQRELEELPAKIEELEAKQAELSERLADPTLYQSKNGEFQKVERELNELHHTIEKTMARWEELEKLRSELQS